MLKLKNDLTIEELTDLLACLDRTQDDLKQVISNRTTTGAGVKGKLACR